MREAEPLQIWIDHVFDHPVADPQWYFSDDAPATVQGAEEWPEARADVADHIIQTFENSTHHLTRFTDKQINQGFWYLFGNSDPRFMDAIYEKQLPLRTREAILQSWVSLFEQLMATRCSSHLGHLGEASDCPLNSSCYMWFDVLPGNFEPDKFFDAGLGPKLVTVLGSVLAIPHDACRESGLHGIGHWVSVLPELTATVDHFLDTNSGLRPELIEYAKRARAGKVL